MPLILKQPVYSLALLAFTSHCPCPTVCPSCLLRPEGISGKERTGGIRRSRACCAKQIYNIVSHTGPAESCSSTGFIQNRRVHRNPMKHFASIPLPQQTAVAVLAITGRPHTVSATTCAARRAGQDMHLQASPPVPQSGPDPPPPRCPEPLGTAGSQGAGAPAVPGGSWNLWSPTGVPQATSPHPRTPQGSETPGRADGFIGEDPVNLRFADNRSVGAIYKPTYQRSSLLASPRDAPAPGLTTGAPLPRSLLRGQERPARSRVLAWKTGVPANPATASCEYRE